MRISVRGTKLFVDMDGFEWRWEKGRLGHAPPLFVLHGGPGSNHTRLKREMGFLSRWFQVVYIDQRGCGFSAPCPTRTLTLSHNVEDLEALRKALGFDRISLLGSSYGGMVAATYAARYTKRLDLLFLLGTAGSGAFIRAAQEYLRKHGTPAQIKEAERLWKGTFRTQTQLRRFFEILGPLYSRRPSSPTPPARQPKLVFNLDALNKGFRDVLPRWNVLPALRRVRVPTFIAVGRYDWICPVSQSKALAEHLPLSTLKLYPCSAHSPANDEPARFRADMAYFLRRWKSRVRPQRPSS